MATKPTVKVFSNNSVDVLNVIRNNASQNYKDYVPVATKDAESLKQIGAIIMDYPSLQNEFLNALVNRIGRVIITSKMYSNPWSMFKKGFLDYGETIEEIFVNLAKPHQFDPAVAETNLFKREIPDVKAAFHVMNYQKFYKQTISDEQLRQAFLSWEGITDLIAKIVDAMYTGANYDEFITMKYMLARHILDGRIAVSTIPEVTQENMTTIAATIKQVSNDFTFLSTDYNPAGVYTHSEKDDQFLIVSSKYDAVLDVEVLAFAFNMDRAQFAGHRVLVDSFGKLDNARLAELFADDPNYTPIEEDDLALLDAIPAVIVDRSWFMVFDNYQGFRENINGEGLSWQYFYHVWKTFSVSPFANSTMFSTGTQGITSVTVTPSALTMTAGMDAHLGVSVVATGFAPQTVTWSTSDATKATVDQSGNVTTLSTATDTVTITATSTFDDTKKGTCTITFAAAG